MACHTSWGVYPPTILSAENPVRKAVIKKFWSGLKIVVAPNKTTSTADTAPISSRIRWSLK
jgi:hypothetical protein